MYSFGPLKAVALSSLPVLTYNERHLRHPFKVPFSGSHLLSGDPTFLVVRRSISDWVFFWPVDVDSVTLLSLVPPGSSRWVRLAKVSTFCFLFFPPYVPARFFFGPCYPFCSYLVWCFSPSHFSCVRVTCGAPTTLDAPWNFLFICLARFPEVHDPAKFSPIWRLPLIFYNFRFWISFVPPFS